MSQRSSCGPWGCCFYSQKKSNCILVFLFFFISEMSHGRWVLRVRYFLTRFVFL